MKPKYMFDHGNDEFLYWESVFPIGMTGRFHRVAIRRKDFWR